MNATILRDRECSNMCLSIFPITSIIFHWLAGNHRRPEMAFPSIREWNQIGYGMIVSGVSEFMNIFGDICLSGTVKVTAYLLLGADNWSIQHDLLAY
jgi:hypothetical protein